MNSPDCWRMETAHYPDCRGYAGCFLLSAIPIAGEYLEVPSTRGPTNCRQCMDALLAVPCQINELALSDVKGEMMRVTTAVIALLFALPAWADWTRFSALEADAVVVYVDIGSIRREGDKIRLWQLFDFKEPDSRGRRSYRTLAELDCKESKIRYVQDEYFAGKMASGALLDSNATPHEWTYAAPGTLPMMMLTVHCQK